MTKLSMRKLVCCGVWLLMCLKLIECGQLPTKLSPRIVKTKYGQIRGIIIDYQPTDSALADLHGQQMYQATSSAHKSTLPNETAQFNKFLNLNDPHSSHSNVHTSTNNNLGNIQIEAFLGVSYAQPPIADRRFLPPVSPAHFRGIKVVDQFQPVCIQKLPKELQQQSSTDQGFEYNVFRTNKTEQLNEQQSNGEDNESSFYNLANYLRNQSEDCLYLNAYVPNYKDKPIRKDRLPVLVFVHGPSYNYGSGNPYDGSVLAWFGELIVITLNYRLGAFGFLSTESDGNVRGNYGLLDLVAALHWINDNIAQFGGDQTNITLVGHNRGAALVHLLTLSNMSKNLFHRVALMSGSALSPWAISTQSQFYAKQIADKLGCNNQNSINSDLKGDIRSNSLNSIDCLRQKSAKSINNVYLETSEPLRSSFGPVVDGLVVPVDPAQLVNTSQNLGLALQSNLFTLNFGHRSGSSPQSPSLNSMQVNKPLLFGFTRVETPPFIFTKQEQQKGISSRRKGEMLRTLVSNMFSYYQEAISLTLINEYTDWTSNGEQNFIDSVIDILGDALVVAPMQNSVNLHLKLSGQKQRQSTNVYSYVFVYQPEMSSLQSARLGCTHGGELEFLFGAPIARHQFDIQLKPFQANYSQLEVNLSKQLIQYWSNFVKYSNPNGKDEEIRHSYNMSNINLPESTLWPSYDQQRRYLMLGVKSKPRDHYHAHRLSIWLQLIPKLQLQGRFEMEQLKRNIKEETGQFQQQVLNHQAHQNSLASDQFDSNKSYLSQWLDNLVDHLLTRILSVLHFNNNEQYVSNTFEYHFLTTIAQQLNSNLLNSQTLASSQNASSKARSSSTPYNLIKPNSLSTSLFNANDFSTVSLIFAIGLTLLLLNLFVFLLVYVVKKRKAKKKANKKDDLQKQTEDSNNLKLNNQQKKARKKQQSIDSTVTGNLDTNRNTINSYLPMASSMSNTLANSLTNAYQANQSTDQTANAIYGPTIQHTYYYNNVTNNDLNCLSANNANTNTTIGQATNLNNALTGTLGRRADLEFSDYCSSTDEQQHLCIYNTTDRTGNSSLLKVQSQNAQNSDLNRSSVNSDTNSNGQHSTLNSTFNCLSQNSQLSGISCQCDNCNTIRNLNPNSPLTNQLLNNNIITGQTALLNGNLVNLVNSSLCDNQSCNLTVIHEFEERL